VHQISKILSEDPTAFENRLKICGELGLPAFQCQQFKSLENYEFFSKVLETWRSEFNDADVDTLCGYLRDLRINSAAGKHIV
jgi:hypothetical protein